MSCPLYFYDQASDRMMKLEWWGTPKQLWIFYQHPDGQWVSLRVATSDDIQRLNRAGAALEAQHDPNA